MFLLLQSEVHLIRVERGTHTPIVATMYNVTRFLALPSAYCFFGFRQGHVLKCQKLVGIMHHKCNMLVKEILFFFSNSRIHHFRVHLKIFHFQRITLLLDRQTNYLQMPSINFMRLNHSIPLFESRWFSPSM